MPRPHIHKKNTIHGLSTAFSLSQWLRNGGLQWKKRLVSPWRLLSRDPENSSDGVGRNWTRQTIRGELPGCYKRPPVFIRPRNGFSWSSNEWGQCRLGCLAFHLDDLLCFLVTQRSPTYLLVLGIEQVKFPASQLLKEPGETSSTGNLVTHLPRWHQRKLDASFVLLFIFLSTEPPFCTPRTCYVDIDKLRTWVGVSAHWSPFRSTDSTLPTLSQRTAGSEKCRPKEDQWADDEGAWLWKYTRAWKPARCLLDFQGSLCLSKVVHVSLDMVRGERTRGLERPSTHGELPRNSIAG